MDPEERYKALINARNFHYDNFSKWMTYFYIAIGALFVGYCTIISSDKAGDLIMLEYLLIVMGFIASILWYWSAKGYYYWNIHFISMINYYERDVLKFDEKERVYLVFANKDTQNDYCSPVSGANISTSKIAILFAFLVTCCWAFLLFNKLSGSLSQAPSWCSVLFQASLAMATVWILSVLIPGKYLASRIDHHPDLKFDLEQATDHLTTDEKP